jgi:NADP-dependent 3-hydroxy acid dehydrogenase YdfG
VADSTYPWRIVWITGASTGIGRELALRLARGGVKVAVSARSTDKLAALAAENSNITAFPLDVTDRQAVAQTVAAIYAQLGAIDLAVLNAGVWHPMGAHEYDSAKAIEAMNVNYNGVVLALGELLPHMMKRRSGHISMVASVAGYRGLVNAGSYAPTKAALIALAECLKPDLFYHKVKISVINPGFVDTPMTSVNKFPMPFMITTEDAVSRIVAGLQQKYRFEIAFPWPIVGALKLMRILPYSTYFFLTRHMNTMQNPPDETKVGTDR